MQMLITALVRERERVREEKVEAMATVKPWETQYIGEREGKMGNVKKDILSVEKKREETSFHVK